MAKFTTTLTVGKIVTGAYLLIWLVPLTFSIATQSSLNDRVAQLRLQQAASPLPSITQQPKPNHLSVTHALARKIRMLSDQYKNETDQIQYLLDLKIIIWAVLMLSFIFGAFILVPLINKIYAAFNALAKAISNLSEGQLAEPVKMFGSQNFSSAGQQLEKLRLRLIATERHQASFLRHISHEIKTPLTSINEGTQLLEDEVIGPINTEQREITDILSSSTAELQTSIESLLNFNSALSVQQVRQREVVNLADLINQTIDKHALTIKSKKIQMISNRQNHRAFIDREQIRTVIDNLISNAIKYSPDGGRIWLRLDHIADDIIFTIKDQGAGIKKDQQAAVFDAFYVGNNESKGPLKGTGLGLSIARQYVEAHRGTIKALDSAKGAAFEFTLPA